MLLAPNHCWETISWQDAFLYTINCIFEEADIRHSWRSSEGETLEVRLDYLTAEGFARRDSIRDKLDDAIVSAQQISGKTIKITHRFRTERDGKVVDIFG